MVTEKKFTRKHNYMRLIEYLNTFGINYYFRGQSDANWPNIKSTLLRIIEEHKKDSIAKNFEMFTSEWSLLQDLKGKLHLLTNEINENDDTYSKLSFLQHNGMPTKIIDLTHSPFVALYFSLSEKQNVSNSAIYAINSQNIYKKNQLLVKMVMKELGSKLNLWEYKAIEEKNDVEKVTKYNAVFNKNEEIITIYNPQRKNRKIIAQQGGFLIPSNPLANLDKELYKYSDKENDFIKITYPREWCNVIYKYLKIHNINGETLFPGLEGYIIKKRQDLIFDH